MISYLVLSIALLYLSFPNFFNHFGFWPLAWIFAVPLFFVLEGQPLRKRVLWGALFGLVFYAFLVQWLMSYSLLGYILFVLVLTIQPIIFTSFYKTSNRLVDIIYIPALWVASECIRTVFLNGFSWNLGYSQTFNIYALQTANLFGSWGISFVVILVNYCFYAWIRNHANKKWYAAAVCIAITFVAGYGAWSLRPELRSNQSPGTINICAVQSNIDSNEKRDPDRIAGHIAHQIALSQSCLAKKKPDLIVWPETAIATDFLQDPKMKDQMIQFVRAAGVPVLVGAALWKGEENQNSAVLLEPDGSVGAIYHKRYLVPFSEYVPFPGILPLKSFNFVPGEQLGLLSLTKAAKAHRFGVAICSEDTIGSLFRRFSKRGAEFVIVLLNDGWFKQDAALVMHGQNAIMHAAENRIPTVRVGNTGWTSFIDPVGRVQSLTEPWFNKKAVVTYNLVPHRERTLFNRIGDVFAVFCFVFVIILLTIQSRGNRH